MNTSSKVILSTFFIFGLVLFTSCGNKKVKDRDFIITEKLPATALTIGWYAPVDVLEALVGENYTPRIVKEGELSSIMLYIVKSDEHMLDGQQMGPMRSAHLVIPIETPDGLKVDDQDDIEASMVCVINIVDESKGLGDKYNEYAFATYSGEINLDISMVGEKYMVDASVKTVNGLIGIKGMFDQNGETNEVVAAMFSSKSESPAYFYGEEKVTRYKDGKGNLNYEGQNMITAMNLAGQPYFLRFDKDISWSFDFVQE